MINSGDKFKSNPNKLSKNSRLTKDEKIVIYNIYLKDVRFSFKIVMIIDHILG